MTELDNIYWATNNEYWTMQDKFIDQLIYQSTRLQYRTFYYNVLYYYYRRRVLSLKSGTVLDTLNDLRLFTKKCRNPWIWCSSPITIPITIPITFDEFLNNRSLSKYVQKASKEINYGNSNSNNNNN